MGFSRLGLGAALALAEVTAFATPRYRASLIEAGVREGIGGISKDGGYARLRGLDFGGGDLFAPFPSDVVMRAHTRNDVMGYYTRSIYHDGLHTYAPVKPLRLNRLDWREEWRSFDLNEQGDFVGVQSYIDQAFGHDAHAVAYIDGKAFRIDPSNHDEFGYYTDSWAVGINNSRVVVGNEGESFDKGSFQVNLFNTHAWKWEKGVQTFLPLARATDIADDGTILGNDYDSFTNEVWEPFLVKGDSKTKIPAPAMFFGDKFLGYEEFGINNTGTVIGQYIAKTTGVPVREGVWLHQGGQTYDIYAITEGLPSSLTSTFYPSRINDLGQFTAFVKYGNTYHNYRFDPVPEPATFLALGAGLAAIMRRRRR